MGLEAAGFLFYSVPPTTWQRFFDLRKTDKERTKTGGQVMWKKRLQSLAEELFGITIPLSQADAFLLSEYAKENTK